MTADQKETLFVRCFQFYIAVMLLMLAVGLLKYFGII
jgi:hypothetical protein